MFGFKKKVTPGSDHVPQSAFMEESDANTLKVDYPHRYSQGVYKGKGSKPTTTEKNEKELKARNLYTGQHMTVIEISKELGLSRTQIYTYLGDLIQKRPRKNNAK